MCQTNPEALDSFMRVRKQLLYRNYMLNELVEAGIKRIAI